MRLLPALGTKTQAMVCMPPVHHCLRSFVVDGARVCCTFGICLLLYLHTAMTDLTSLTELAYRRQQQQQQGGALSAPSLVSPFTVNSGLAGAAPGSVITVQSVRMLSCLALNPTVLEGRHCRQVDV